jgi:hypothetical protein
VRLSKGKHALAATAAGSFDLARELEVTAPAEVALRLNPKPARALTHHREVEAPVWRPRQPVANQWTISGTITPQPGTAGIMAEAAAGVWSSASRDNTQPLSVVKRAEGAVGWQLVWELVPPAGTGTAEMRLLGSAAGIAVVGVRADGEMYLGLRRGAALEVLASRTFAPLPQPLHADWDGKVLVVWAKDELVGSTLLPWTPVEERIEIAAEGGRAEFRSMLVRPLIELRPQ